FEEVDEVGVDVAGVVQGCRVGAEGGECIDGQRGAVGPVAVDAGLVDPGELGDLVVTQAADPVAGDELGGGLKNPAPHPGGAPARTAGRLACGSVLGHGRDPTAAAPRAAGPCVPRWPPGWRGPPGRPRRARTPGRPPRGGVGAARRRRTLW